MAMRIRVLLFGQLKDIVGRHEETLEIEPGAKLASLVARYADRFPKFQALSGSIACSVNQEYAVTSTILRDGDEVALLPPVSGGKGTAAGELRSAHCAIV